MSTSRYICEITPPRMRGPLASMVQLLTTIGLCVGFFACYGTALIPSSLSWRLPFALQAAIALALAAASYFFLPQSPRWLAHKGRRAEASKAWDNLGVSNAEREKDLLLNSAEADGTELTNSGRQDASGNEAERRLSFLSRVQLAMDHLRAAFGQDTRSPMLLGIFLMSMQQLSGIDGVIYVSFRANHFHHSSKPSPIDTFSDLQSKRFALSGADHRISMRPFSSSRPALHPQPHS